MNQPQMKPAGDPGKVMSDRAALANPEAPQEGAPAEGGDAQNPVKSMVMLGQAMDQLGQGLQKAGAPPEALQKLQEASASYKEFLQILGGNPVDGQPEAPSSSVPPAQPGQPALAKVPGRNIVPAKGNQGY